MYAYSTASRSVFEPGAPEQRTIHPAATAVLLRDSSDGLQVLMLRRHRDLAVLGGAWVFPGGRLDDADYAGDAADHEAAARRAALRETREEAALAVLEHSLQLISHWTTPAQAKRRFATWFYLGEADDHRVEVDGGEIDHHRWVAPAVVLSEHRAGQMELMPPTVVTLTELQGCADIAAARAFYAARQVPYFEPRMATLGDVICMLYQGDAGYEAVDASAPGARNRCWLEAGGIWRFESSQ